MYRASGHSSNSSLQATASYSVMRTASKQARSFHASPGQMRQVHLARSPIRIAQPEAIAVSRLHCRRSSHDSPTVASLVGESRWLFSASGPVYHPALRCPRPRSRTWAGVGLHSERCQVDIKAGEVSGYWTAALSSTTKERRLPAGPSRRTSCGTGARDREAGVLRSLADLDDRQGRRL